MKKPWNVKPAEKTPPRKGADLQDDTKALIEEINEQSSHIVELTFTNKNELKTYFNRLKYAKKRGLFNYHKISRRGDSLFIELQKEHKGE